MGETVFRQKYGQGILSDASVNPSELGAKPAANRLAQEQLTKGEVIEAELADGAYSTD